MTVYHYAPFPVAPALTFAAALAVTLLGHLTSKAVRKMARVRAMARSQSAVRMGYRERRRY